jgi:hypothetical protein
MVVQVTQAVFLILIKPQVAAVVLALLVLTALIVKAVMVVLVLLLIHLGD